MTSRNEELEQYANLLIRLGVNLQPGQSLAIRTEPIHRDFALLVAEAAYDAGAKYVAIEYSDMRLQSVRIRKSEEQALEHLPNYIGEMARERKDDGWAAISLVGEEDPSLPAQLDPNRLRILQTAEYRAIDALALVDDGDETTVERCRAAHAGMGAEGIPHATG